MIDIASNGHFFTQMPQPMHSSSEIHAIFDVGATSIQSLPGERKGRERGVGGGDRGGRENGRARHIEITASFMHRSRTHSDNWAARLALLTAFLRLALQEREHGIADKGKRTGKGAASHQRISDNIPEAWRIRAPYRR